MKLRGTTWRVRCSTDSTVSNKVEITTNDELLVNGGPWGAGLFDAPPPTLNQVLGHHHGTQFRLDYSGTAGSRTLHCNGGCQRSESQGGDPDDHTAVGTWTATEGDNPDRGDKLHQS